MQKQKNLSFLILTLLILIFYPEIIKLTHVHSIPHHRGEQEKGTILNPTAEPCAICNFQFVSFIGSQEQLTTIDHPTINVANSKIPEISSVRYLTYFSLRAPPQA